MRWPHCARINKSVFPDKPSALYVAEQTNRSNRKNSDYSPVVPYRCDHCRGWHVGHQEKSGLLLPSREGLSEAYASVGPTGPKMERKSKTMARKQEAKQETGTAITTEKELKRELSNIGPADYYEEYGRQASSRPIVGKLLKFSKGDYLAGQENEEVEEGTELVACMDTLQVGWVKWQDDRPVDQDMGLLLEGFRPKKRGELGDQDQDQWETDEQSGKPRDPWQFANQLVMRPTDWDGEDESLYTFVTQSKGGVSAIGALCKYYGKEMRQRTDEYPVIKLEVDSYMHSNKQFGRIKVPVLTPTEEWVEKDPVVKRKVPAKPDAKKGRRAA